MRWVRARSVAVVAVVAVVSLVPVPAAFAAQASPELATFVIYNDVPVGDSGFSGDFTIDYACTGADDSSGTVLLAPAEESDPIQTADGATCTATIREYPAAPAGWEWLTQDRSASSTIHSDRPGPALTLTTYIISTELTARFTITVDFDDAGSGFDGLFEVFWSCFGDMGESTTLHAGESTEVIGVPVGMPCEVGISEYDDPPPGWRWDWEMDSLTTGVPRVMPASAVETPLDVHAQIWIEEMAGDLSLRIVVDNQAGIAFTDEFTGTWTCDLAG
ncbi:MAG: DUF5979 domain-containing protein, partial [Microbacterium sp.]